MLRMLALTAAILPSILANYQRATAIDARAGNDPPQVQKSSDEPKGLPVLNGGPCEPEVSAVAFGHPGKGISTRIQALFDEDQAREASAKQGKSWDKIVAEDQGRQKEVLGYLEKGEVNSADELYHVAMIFQHGDCPDHFKLANRLAEMAIEKGSDPAKWLYAATLDRYLMSQGKPQKFGTQFFRDRSSGRWMLYPFDTSTTDEERAKYHVPALAVQKEKEKLLNQPK